jgi:YgiT-type zinc finger domain-containing protein
MGREFFKAEKKMTECFICKSDDVKESTTVQTYQENGHLIVIKGIPCLECKNCGETYLTTEVLKALEKFLDTVQCAEVEIVSYDKVAA